MNNQLTTKLNKITAAKIKVTNGHEKSLHISIQITALKSLHNLAAIAPSLQTIFSKTAAENLKNKLLSSFPHYHDNFFCLFEVKIKPTAPSDLINAERLTNCNDFTIFMHYIRKLVLPTQTNRRIMKVQLQVYKFN